MGHDSMDGGDAPIRDGDLVLCAWAEAVRAEEVEGRPVLLQGLAGGLPFAVIKVPRQVDGRWQLHSWNPSARPIEVDEETTLRVVARVAQVVEPASGLVLWARYDRDTIARQFRSQYGRPWQVGHKDVVVDGVPHTILMVTLHKQDLADEYGYADRFLSPTEFQWESRASVPGLTTSVRWWTPTMLSTRPIQPTTSSNRRGRSAFSKQTTRCATEEVSHVESRPPGPGRGLRLHGGSDYTRHPGDHVHHVSRSDG